MTSLASIDHSICSDGTYCGGAVISPVLSAVFVCRDMNTECMHALACDTTCYCAHHDILTKPLSLGEGKNLCLVDSRRVLPQIFS